MALRNKKFELSPRLKLGVGRAYSQNKILKFAAVLCLGLAIVLSVNAVRLVIKSNHPPVEDNSQPQVLGASDIKPSGQPVIEFSTYTVQKGDTLFNVAKKFGISWATLATINNIKSTSLLQQGQQLKVPKQ